MDRKIVRIGDKVIKQGSDDPVEIKSMVIERHYGPDKYDIFEEPKEISVTRFKRNKTLICYVGAINAQDKMEYFRADQIERVA